MSCLVQGHVAKKWQTWALKPGSPAPESTLPTLLPCCFLDKVACSALSQAEDIYSYLSFPSFLSIALSTPHSSPKSSRNPPFVQYVSLSPSCQAGLERRQDRWSPGPYPPKFHPPFFQAWMRR